MAARRSTHAGVVSSSGEAVAIEEGATVVTRNTEEFERFENLDVEAY